MAYLVIKEASPLHNKPSKRVAYKDGRPREDFHNACKVCHMLSQAACLHVRQPLALPLPSQAHCIAVISCRCKVGQEVLLQCTASMYSVQSDTCAYDMASLPD